jgi:hypothetical protein
MKGEDEREKTPTDEKKKSALKIGTTAQEIVEKSGLQDVKSETLGETTAVRLMTQQRSLWSDDLFLTGNDPDAFQSDHFAVEIVAVQENAFAFCEKKKNEMLHLEKKQKLNEWIDAVVLQYYYYLFQIASHL